MATTIRVKSANLLRKDTAENWTKKNPVLRQGEEGYETDTGRRKVGDGTTAWKELFYTVDQTYTPDSENAQSGKAVAGAITAEQKRANSAFANALKGTKSGSAILIDDISPITHDMSVKVGSKNLFDISKLVTSTQIINNGNGSITIKYYGVNGETLGTIAPNLVNGKTYVLSCVKSNDNARNGIYLNTVLSLGKLTSITFGTPFVMKEEYREAVTIWYCEKNDNGENIENTLSNIQLELGTEVTDYTPYAPDLTAVKVKKSNAFGEIVAEYTPSADGTVEGVTSLYPNTTLTTDTDGVIIDCEYNKDINKFSGIDADVPTKTSELINDSNFATQDFVEQEIANFDFIKIVTALPETGLVNRTYFVPKQDPVTNDLYDEYMWVDGKWELITTKQIEVDLTDYVKHTDINQSYDPTSENAQSGKAVAEAVAPKADKTELNKLKEDLSNNRYEILNLSLDERLEGSANAKFFTTSVTAEGIELSSLNIRRLLFRIKYPSSDEYTGAKMYIAFNDMNHPCGTIAVKSDSVVCGEMEVIDRYNIYFPTPQNAALSYNAANYQLSGAFLYDNLDKLGTDENKINSIQFYANYSNGTVLPAGTEITIIGIAY